MKQYRVVAVNRQPTYLSLLLQPETPADVLRFSAGQYAAIGFKRRGRMSPMRCFSMTSAPQQTQQLEFAMRVGGHFTQSIANLQPGQQVAVQGPFGDFTIDPTYDRQIVLIAGGIGITPFISMLRDAENTQSQLPIRLLYACRSKQDIPFYQTLQQLAQNNPNLQIDYVLSDQGAELNLERLQNACNNSFGDRTWFVCGPEGLRQNVQKILQQQGVDVSRIVSESFSQGNQLSSLFGLKISTLSYTMAGLLLLASGAFIAGVDLVRAIPKLAAQQPAQQPANPVPSTKASDDDTNEDGTSQTVAPTSNTSSPTPTPTPATNTTTPTTSTQTYQAPTSRVS